MNRLQRSVLQVARFTLQARTALSIGTGGPDGVYDHPIVRDANGLPTIPGTALAGLLRALSRGPSGSDRAVNDLFGWQDRDEGTASRVEVAACALQDSTGRSAEGLLIDAAGRKRLSTDRLLRAALATQADPLFRDRVRLTHRGVAGKTGKYDRGLLPAGHRFSGELRLWSKDKEDPQWHRLLGLLADPRLRLGGATRAGMGAMDLVTLHTGSFDLCEPADVPAYRALGPRLDDTEGLVARAIETLPKEAAIRTLSIELRPRDFWRFGQGNQSLSPRRDGEKVPDLLPKVEPVVTWNDGRAHIGTRLALVPGSSVKGALAHRTAFHWNALNQRFVDELSADEIADWDKSEHCEGVREIFGYAKDRATATDRAPEETGHAGQVIIDDVQIEMPAEELQRHLQTMIHNSLDRFTGGVRDRMLFTEELIYQRPIRLRITLLPGLDLAGASARQALARAIRDLCEGRLGLGAGTTKGHGSFTGTVDETARTWLNAQGEDWT